MKIYNTLQLFVDCLKKWETLPSESELLKNYLEPLENLLAPMLKDFSSHGRPSFYETLSSLNWKEYREQTLGLDPSRELKRLKHQMSLVENIFSLTLECEVVLWGAFTLMDGYARFDKGTHRVYLGVDEQFLHPHYLNILMSHELTHVARESRPSVWTGFGLDPEMSHTQFQKSQPVIEHLFSEGFSCVVSEILNPSDQPWNYVYQTKDSLEQVFENGPAVDRVVHHHLKDKSASYRTLYDLSQYSRQLPRYSHYAWAWQWVKKVLADFGHGDPKQILTLCSKELMDHAMSFRLGC